MHHAHHVAALCFIIVLVSAQSLITVSKIFAMGANNAGNNDLQIFYIFLNRPAW